MTVIKNVGELASPYFLIEVFARRGEIDIDPETFATLKQKSRALVRDARGFELRGQEPDEDWQARRLDLLGIQSTRDFSVNLDDGEPFGLKAYGNGDGVDAVLVGDLPGFTDPDRRVDKAIDPPATRFELALDAYEGDADWGLLLAGTSFRVYRRSSGISQQYLQVDLESLVELDDDNTWKGFAAIFRAPAFVAEDGEVPLIRRVVDESRRHASALAVDMRRDVVDAAERLIQGALDHQANQLILGEPGRSQLQQLFEETLYYLYRILFVLYAEAREILPVNGAGPYPTTYSVDHLIELARAGGVDEHGTYFGDSLRRLFDLLWQGPEEAAHAIGIDAVGGELFDPTRTALLDACVIPDSAWAPALISIAVGEPGSARAKLGRRSSFAELGVDQLGSIYEGLLVLEPYLSPGPRALVLIDGDRRIVPEDEVGSYRLVRHLEAGYFVLESASGRRKGSGSFYTPHEITEYLTHAALDPIVEPIVELAATDPDAAQRELLALKICDPAMGSGAFLVQAARVLGLAYARTRAVRAGIRVTPELIHQAERTVVRECLYGVDLNPLAVVLAKVSLWLETLEKGKPLSFLDAHLRCGDALVGVDFVSADGSLGASDLATWPAPAAKGLTTYLRKEAGERGEPLLERLKSRKAPKSAAQAKLPGIDAVAIEEALETIAGERRQLLEHAGDSLADAVHSAEAFGALEGAEASLRNRLRAASDFWAAQWFSEGEDAPEDAKGIVVPANVADFETIVTRLLEGHEIPERLQAQEEAARRVAERRHFFHWALEFPEVMVERSGFDAVIGNPPWNTLSPSDGEFFGTFDPSSFAKGVTKKRKLERKGDLRQVPDIDAAWRGSARLLHELANYAKPESGRFQWHAPTGQLRKGDANVFRLFVERGYKLLRRGGRLAQVLPEALYVSMPATGLRQHLLVDGLMDRCFVFENRQAIFPIHRSVKVCLLVVSSGLGPTDQFSAAFFVGKGPAGQDRSVGLDRLPGILGGLDSGAPTLSQDQVRRLAPDTWSFPELQTALDASVALHCADKPPLNRDEHGWQIEYCRELDATNDAWRFVEEGELIGNGARRDGLIYVDDSGGEWWPVVSGVHFYHLEFPADGKEIRYWARASDLKAIAARQAPDGSSVMLHYRVAYRDVASPTNERSAISAILPPKTVATNKAPTVWGGTQDAVAAIALCALLSSFVFDYNVRFRGATSLRYGILNQVPAPQLVELDQVLRPALEVVCSRPGFVPLWNEVYPKESIPSLDLFDLGQRRASIDALVATAYGLSLKEYAAVLCAFPNIDRSQPMLPGEPKSFVTRDYALNEYCRLVNVRSPDVAKLMRGIGADIPDPQDGLRGLDERMAEHVRLGAIPYRPTPKGAKPPTDPSLISEVLEMLGSDPVTISDVADALEQDQKTVSTVVKKMEKDGVVLRDGTGKGARYYMVEEDE
ncbi:MAG: N-6 DNA methylase [Actinomycetota bacterium]|nr:N-6 DNA methylase [Actinomycetota bacterium]